MVHKSIDKVAVVIPNLNGADYIRDAVDSLLSQTLSSTIIVVDNASIDDSLEILASYGKKITTIKNTRNLGFAGGVNTGITYALEHDFEAIALFNNDAVANPDWLERLVEAMDNSPDVGIATCQIQLAHTKLLDSTGEFYTIWGLPFPRGRKQAITAYPDEEYVFGASGGASLYRSEALRQIGLFDEKFFAYYEDTDISFRAQLQGWKVLYVPSSRVTHRQGQTSKKMVRGFTVFQTFKNLPMLFWKNVPIQLVPSIGIRFFAAYTLIFLKALFSDKGLQALKGFIYSIIFIPHTIHERLHIQKNKKVHASYIRALVIHDLPPDQTGLRKLRKVFIGR